MPSLHLFWAACQIEGRLSAPWSDANSNVVNVPCTPVTQSPGSGSCAWPAVTHGSEVLQAARETA